MTSIKLIRLTAIVLLAFAVLTGKLVFYGFEAADSDRGRTVRMIKKRGRIVEPLKLMIISGISHYPKRMIIDRSLLLLQLKLHHDLRRSRTSSVHRTAPNLMMSSPVRSYPVLVYFPLKANREPFVERN